MAVIEIEKKRWEFNVKRKWEKESWMRVSHQM
jgi:hypothetical protein